MYDTPDSVVVNDDLVLPGADASAVTREHFGKTPLSAVCAREMLKVSKTPCRAANGEERVGQLTMMAAKLLGAEGCMIMLLESDDRDELRFRMYSSACPDPAPACREWADQGEAAAREAILAGKSVLVEKRAVSSNPGLANQATASVRSIIASPVLVDNDIVGVVNLMGPEGPRRFGSDEVAVVEIVAWLVGQALHAIQLEKVLNSRFAQLAIAQEADHAIGNALVVARGRPEQLARILAKSFYREMVKLGFASGQIIGAASEIISQLSGNLKKYSDRWQKTQKS